MLYGAVINVYTDRKNLLHEMTQFTLQRVTRWRLLLEDYDASFHYKDGKSNFFADALSRGPTSSSERKDTTRDLLHILSDEEPAASMEEVIVNKKRAQRSRKTSFASNLVANLVKCPQLVCTVLLYC